MRHAAFFSLLCLLFLPGFSQEVQEGYKKINQFIVPVDLLDPAYPVMKSTGDEVRDAETFRIELRIYTKTIGKFPKYISTGDQAKDEAAYDEACKLYLAQHPYFPQPINTNNPRGDEQNFDRWYKAYIKFYPAQAKRVIISEEGGVK